MTDLRERPSEAQVDAWVAAARPVVLENAARRHWWRRLSRPTVVLSVVGAVAAGGIAYSAVERTRTGAAPELFTGDSVLEIGAPGPDDKWLNISVRFRCERGERISIRAGAQELMESGCPKNGTDSYGSRGMSGSEPRADIHVTKLIVKSTISHDYRITAEWGPRAVSQRMMALPPVGADGQPQWKIPTYRVNEYGLTVGDHFYMDQPEETYPDLLPTRFKGRVAYFRMKDSLQDANTLEEIERQARERREQGLDVGGKRYRWVYAADGETRLGKVRVD